MAASPIIDLASYAGTYGGYRNEEDETIRILSEQVRRADRAVNRAAVFAVLVALLLVVLH